MTTPDERRRNQTWASEQLAQLAEDDTLDPALRHRAADLLARYPSAEVLDWLEQDDLWRRRFVPYAPLFNAVALLLREVGLVSDADRRRQLDFILRHFP